MSAAKSFKLVVDRELCQGHNRCVRIAPELFDLDEYGQASAKGDGSVPAALQEKAILAEKNCPEFAIRIDPPIDAA